MAQHDLRFAQRDLHNRRAVEIVMALMLFTSLAMVAAIAVLMLL